MYSQDINWLSTDKMVGVDLMSGASGISLLVTTLATEPFHQFYQDFARRFLSSKLLKQLKNFNT